MKTSLIRPLKLLLAALLALGATAAFAAPVTLLNVSFDPTRELYEEYNPQFIAYWKDKTGQEVKVNQSHGGSGNQARAVIEGLKADVVTLALAYDIDEIAARGHLLPADWQSKFPDNSTPYSSVIVFLVRKGNPKNVHDWDDLVKGEVKVITPNPKTSGGARWNYLAAWGWAWKKNNSDDAAKTYISQLFKHVPLLDAGARGATTTFVRRGMGDVLIAWESEALLITQQMDKEHFEIVYPSLSIRAETPVAVVEKNAQKKDTTELAHAYLEHLYSKEAQEIIANHYYRPADADIAAKYKDRFPAVSLLTINDFGGWGAAQEKHFAEGGVFDQIYMK
jgi:sulfate transport system substrate-binding protein